MFQKIVPQRVPPPAPPAPPPVDANQLAGLFRQLQKLIDLLSEDEIQALPYESVTLVNVSDLVYPQGCKLIGYYLYNNAATVRYVKLYDHAGPVGPLVGGDARPRLTFPVPPAGGANVIFPRKTNIPFWQGMFAACTTGSAFNDTGAPSAGDVIVNLYYAPLKI